MQKFSEAEDTLKNKTAFNSLEYFSKFTKMILFHLKRKMYLFTTRL